MFIINVYTAYYNSRVTYEMKSMSVSDYALMANVVKAFFSSYTEHRCSTWHLHVS